MKIVRQALVTALLVGAVLFGAYVKGKSDGSGDVRSAVQKAEDKAQKHELQRISIVVDSMRTLSDSQARRVVDTVVKTIPVLASAPSVHIVTDTLVQVPDSLVNVYVESEQKAFPTHPFLGRLLVFQDSLIHEVAIPQAKAMVWTIQQQRAVIDTMGNYQLAQQVRITTLEERLAHTKPSKVRRVATWIAIGGAAYVGFKVGRR